MYEATDTIEGRRVALKAPKPELLTPELLKMFQQEARLHARLDHPNILPIKNADLIDGHFLIAYPMGIESLADRQTRRMAFATKLAFCEQMLAAVAYAHSQRIVHRDIKPDNFILFEGARLRLTDFGVSKIAQKTLLDTGSGTLGYMAPEQALGQVSFRSDVFALGIVIWELLSGELPSWPFEWPPAGHAKLRAQLPPEFLELLQRSMEVQERKRFPDAIEMHAAFERAQSKLSQDGSKSSTTWRKAPRRNSQRDSQQDRFRKFLHTHRGQLGLDRTCGECRGPMSGPMSHCPWCGRAAKYSRAKTDFPASCNRCGRGRKLDWKYCAWCFGPGFAEVSPRAWTDRRYVATCSNCRGSLMPFTRYCPWCKRKPTRSWKVKGLSNKCRSCGWGVPGMEWDTCAWCGCARPGSKR